jgi:hypothetical protein
MAIEIGDKVRLKTLTEEEVWSMSLMSDMWDRYKDTTFTVIEKPSYKHPAADYKYKGGKIIYIEARWKDTNSDFCWWVYEKFVTPAQKQLTFIFHD